MRVEAPAANTMIPTLVLSLEEDETGVVFISSSARIIRRCFVHLLVGFWQWFNFSHGLLLFGIFIHSRCVNRRGFTFKKATLMAGSHGMNFGDDTERDFFRGFRTQIQSDWGMQPMFVSLR